MKEIKWPEKIMLDGPTEYEEACTGAIIEGLTDEENAEAMSDKYAYLDD